MKRLVTLLVMVVAPAVLLQSEFSVLYAQAVTFNQTPTGFVWPIGTGSFPFTCGTWLGTDGTLPNPRPDDPRCYDFRTTECRPDGCYHIGFDMLVTQGTYPPVFAISRGVVEHISRNGWGSGNVGLFVRHTFDDDSEFLALYGHIRTSLREGDYVSGGVEFARIGPYSRDHLHLGILPPSTPIPDTNLGRMPNRDWDATNGFEDPVDWITTLSPKCTNGTSQRYRPSGRPAVHPDGSLLTVAGSVPPTVYVLQNGQKRGIPTPERLRELYGPGRGFDFTDIIIVEQDELNQYPTGAPVPVSEPIFDSGLCEPAGRLIQQDGREEISIVTGDCIRRPFGLGQAFLRLGYSTCNVWQIFDYSDPIYTVGPPITQ